MICLNQNLFPLSRQNVRENCNLLISSGERGKALISVYQDFTDGFELNYKDFFSLYIEVWSKPYNYIAIGISKKNNINGTQRINRDMEELEVKAMYCFLCIKL